MGEKVYINGTGHMTKMAAMLIYGKNLQTSNRPRYQVSVYRTIGPPVFIKPHKAFKYNAKIGFSYDGADEIYRVVLF